MSRPMPPPLLLLQDISLSFGTTPVLAGAGLAVAAGDRLCLVGRNGSGKSTLLRIAAGLIQPDDGRRFVQPGATIRYLPQEPDLSGFANTLAYVQAGLVGDADHDRHRARYLLERGASKEARDVLTAAIAGGLDGAPVRSLMGLILHQLGDFAGCERELRQAVRLAPDDGAAEFALASICHRLGHEAEAEAAAGRAIAKGMQPG